MVKLLKTKTWWTLKILEPWETANPNGRPKSIINSVIGDLKQLGFWKVTASDVSDIYLLLIALPKPTLEKLRDDEEKPAVIRIVASRLLSRKGFEAVETLLDRAHGKPKLGEVLAPPINNITLTLVNNGRRATKHTHIDSIPAQLSKPEED